MPGQKVDGWPGGRLAVRRRGPCVALLGLALASPAGAETLGGKVDQHVDDHLPSGGGKKRPKPKKKHHNGPRPRRDWESTGPAPPAAPRPKEKKTDLPHRVFGKRFQLDPSTGLAYRGWRPQEYEKMDVSTENALTWHVGVRAKLYFIAINHAHYESNGIGSPRRSGASVATKAAAATPVAAWFLGAVGFPFDWVLEPIIRYEARAFQSTLKPDAPVRIIPQSASKKDDLSTFPTTTSELTLTSAFETFVVGLRYHHDNDPSGIIASDGGSFPKLYFGVGLTQYSKPYQVRVGDQVLSDLLFDARLRGAGLALGLETGQRPESFFLDVSAQSGIGEVRLTHDFTVNETLPDGWLIGYAQGEVTGGYLHPLTRTRPTLLGGVAASVGGATFFYFKPLTTSEEDRSTPALNWDLLWGLKAFVVVPL